MNSTAINAVQPIEHPLEREQPMAARERARQWEMLIVSLLVIVLTCMLAVRPDGRVAFRGLASYPLPETCLSKSMFHIECPGCGLTRSFIALSRGHLDESLHYHHIGWLLALAVAAQVPYRILSLRLHRALLGATFPRAFGYGLIGALLVNWLLTFPHVR